MNGDRHDLLTVAQLDWLRRLGEWGEARVSNRNDVEHKTISGASAHAFAVRGLTVDVPGQARSHVVRLSDAGRAALAANQGHLPARPQDTAAFARGETAARADVTRAIAELQGVVDDDRVTEAGRNFARHQIERYRALADQQEDKP